MLPPLHLRRGLFHYRKKYLLKLVKGIDNFQNGSIFVVQYRDKTTYRPGGGKIMEVFVYVNENGRTYCYSTFVEDTSQERLLQKIQVTKTKNPHKNSGTGYVEIGDVISVSGASGRFVRVS